MFKNIRVCEAADISSGQNRTQAEVAFDYGFLVTESRDRISVTDLHFEGSVYLGTPTCNRRGDARHNATVIGII